MSEFREGTPAAESAAPVQTVELPEAEVKPAEPGDLLTPAAAALLKELQRCWTEGAVCRLSAARLAQGAGISLQVFGTARRELVCTGMIILGRPAGSTLEICAPNWQCSTPIPMSLKSRLVIVASSLEAAANDLSGLIRAACELDEPADPTRLAGALAAVRDAMSEIGGAANV